MGKTRKLPKKNGRHKLASFRRKNRRTSSRSSKSTACPSRGAGALLDLEPSPEDEGEEPGEGDGDVIRVQEEEKFFRGFDLRGIPLQALPQEGRLNAGRKSYTVSISKKDSETEAVVDVLLEKRAFYVKKGMQGNKTFTWKKCGGVVEAWKSTLERALGGA